MTTIMIANTRVWNVVVFLSAMKCVPNKPSPLYWLEWEAVSVPTFNEHARQWFSVRAIYHWLPNHPSELR